MIATPKQFWFSAKINAIVLTLLLANSCILKQDQKVKFEEIDFKTTDDTELFFKNIRQSDYNLEDRTQAKIKMFRLKKFSHDSLSVELQPAIIHHWVSDKAYIWLEPGGISKTLDKPMKVRVVNGDGTEVSVMFDGSSPQNHIKVAIAIFDASLTESSIYVGSKEILPVTHQNRRNFQLVMNDYFRLLGLK